MRIYRNGAFDDEKGHDLKQVWIKYTSFVLLIKHLRSMRINPILSSVLFLFALNF